MTTLVALPDPLREIVETRVEELLRFRHDLERRAALRQALEAPTVWDRFWAKVDTSGGEDACWPWIGSRDTSGYGQFMLRHGVRLERAHRLAWAIANHRLLPMDRYACHRCDNPPCCNPRHIYAGTASDNARDAIGKGNQGAILTREQATSIRARRGISTTRELTAEFGVGRSAIEAIWAGRHWA